METLSILFMELLRGVCGSNQAERNQEVSLETNVCFLLKQNQNLCGFGVQIVAVCWQLRSNRFR